jgi:hypothetical protein
VVIALAFAGLINMAMVIMASASFHQGHADVAEIGTAWHTLAPLFGVAAAGIFLASLIASGISSSVVGTLAGQMIMQGFVGFQIPLWLRRLVTMAPSFAVVGLGVNATDALVASQVVLSLALPFPMAALVVFTCRRDIMGAYANRVGGVARGAGRADRARAQRAAARAGAGRERAGARLMLRHEPRCGPRHKTLRDAGLNAANAAARERALNNVSNASARSEQRRARHPIDSRSIRARSRGRARTVHRPVRVGRDESN